MRYLSRLLAFFVAVPFFAQGQCVAKYDKTSHRKIYSRIDSMPVFPDGVDGLRRYLEQHLDLPENALEDWDYQSPMVIAFVVETNGRLGSVVVNHKPLSKLCPVEKAYHDLFAHKMKWRPGRCGKILVPVKMEQRMIIEFSE